jgi:hypothetical protein
VLQTPTQNLARLSKKENTPDESSVLSESES